jgi:DNA-binding NtrC family response regulator
MSEQYPERPILIVDDEPYILSSLSRVLKADGLGNIVTCSDSREVLALTKELFPVMILLDLTMPYVSGEQLLEELKTRWPEIPVLIISGVNELSLAVRCMQLGAADYLVKAIENNRLISAVRKVLSLHELIQENLKLKQSLLSEEPVDNAFNAVLTRNSRMISLFRYLTVVARTSRTILLRGETGTGKELLAEGIHTASGRKGQFVCINISGLDDTMFSDTLFGHKRGAFSGAEENRSGLIEHASGGTLFLDEIGDLTPSSQIKLLRLLEKGEYYPLGSDIVKKSSCRIVAATQHDIEKLIREELFRRDLYYRLATHEVILPPLRERLEDLPLLTEHFLELSCRELQCTVTPPTRAWYRCLAALPMEGNVRELQSIIEASVAAVAESGCSMMSALERVCGPAAGGYGGESAEGGEAEHQLQFDSSGPLPTLKEADRLLIDEALSRSGGNISQAARMLGISQPALSRRLARMQSSQE